MDKINDLENFSIVEVDPDKLDDEREEIDDRYQRRGSCIILPIFSLPSNYGIGTVGKEAYKFIEFLAESEQRYWQILPIGPTTYGDSPYQSYSSFAGNPYLIDLELLEEDGLLEKEEFENVHFSDDPSYVNYSLLYLYRLKVLKLAYNRAWSRYLKEIEEFRDKNAYWIEDYALYMALKEYFLDISWTEWPEDIKLRKKEALERYSAELKDEVNFFVFLQYIFFKQWDKLRDIAKKHHIDIIGDIPIYIAMDSADAWANSEILLLDEKTKNPIEVGGSPPDGFTEDGQLWGNPVYDWEYLKNTEYEWWIKRIEINLRFYDILRLDHFIGFSSFWSVPYGDETAKYGKRRKGPGYELFKKLKEELGELPIIIEDLGVLSDEVFELKKKVGYPGMAVLQFGFAPFANSDYIPHNIQENTIVYTGTHDNQTTRAWLEELDEKGFKFVKKYLNLSEEEGYNWGMIRAAMMTNARLAVIPMQDYLNLGDEARMNEPGTLGKNWRWRADKSDFNQKLMERIKYITKLYGRANGRPNRY
ncbi:MAG: 4-alpha-glucanotransferase [Tissierellia bacterium]|nr:4-alpha-glucanotransferase [Tissierellia bacterium]